MSKKKLSLLKHSKWYYGTTPMWYTMANVTAQTPKKREAKAIAKTKQENNKIVAPLPRTRTT